MITIDIKCRFCPTVTAKFEFQNETPEFFLQRAKNSILDNRCDVHKEEHGEYKDMQELYDREVRDDKFQEFMEKSEHKSSLFMENMLKEHPEKVLGRPETSQKLQDEKIKLLKKWKIDKKSIDMQLAEIEKLANKEV